MRTFTPERDISSTHLLTHSPIPSPSIFLCFFLTVLNSISGFESKKFQVQRVLCSASIKLNSRKNIELQQMLLEIWFSQQVHTADDCAQSKSSQISYQLR